MPTGIQRTRSTNESTNVASTAREPLIHQAYALAPNKLRFASQEQTSVPSCTAQTLRQQSSEHGPFVPLFSSTSCSPNQFTNVGARAHVCVYMCMHACTRECVHISICVCVSWLCVLDMRMAAMPMHKYIPSQPCTTPVLLTCQGDALMIELFCARGYQGLLQPLRIKGSWVSVVVCRVRGQTHPHVHWLWPYKNRKAFANRRSAWRAGGHDIGTARDANILPA